MAAFKSYENDPSACIQNTYFYSKITYGPNQIVFHYVGLESQAGEKHSSLLVPFVSYE